MAGTIQRNIGNNILEGAGNIQSPTTLAELLLENGYTSGMITIPFLPSYDFSSTDVPSLKSIPFYTNSNFQFSLGNTWTEMVSSDMLSGGNSLFRMIAIASGKNIKQGNLQSQTMQMANWQKSEVPKFAINTIFVSTTRTISTVKIIKALAAGALPSKGNESTQKMGEVINGIVQGVSDILGSVGFKKDPSQLKKTVTTIANNTGMTAPFGYDPGFKMNTEEGTMNSDPSSDRVCSLTIGKWFSATNLLIDSISSIEFSKETVAPQQYYDSKTIHDPFGINGDPVYVKCNITFRPHTIVTASEFANYFTH